LEKPEFDLIVAGAGPAGSACAIAAARAGAKVLLLEKDRFPRHKVCGEFISPESLHLLAWLLGPEVFRDRPEIGRARVFSAGARTALPIIPPALSVPRFDLDAALLRSAQRAGVETKENTDIREVQPRPIFYVRNGDTTFTGRAVVNATGRWSHLSLHTPAKNSHKWIGLKGHFQEADPPPSVDLYFFQGGYCGVQPVSKNAVNVCAMVRADVAHSLEEVFPMLPELWQRSRDWRAVFPAIATSSLYFRRPRTEFREMLLAGDSAAFIDPFAGDGISLALQSGTLAAESLMPFFQGTCSLGQARLNYHATYMRQFATAFRNAAWVRRILSAPLPVQSVLVRLAGLAPIARALVRSTRTQGIG
jgi:flavin-dependent dehydrogenase